MNKTIAIGLLGSKMDGNTTSERWNQWRPTISMFQHNDLLIDRFELLTQKNFQKLTDTIVNDIHHLSPKTEVKIHYVEFNNPWDLEEVYAKLHDFAAKYPFDVDNEDYLLHITTGTHVAQICMFLLTEARFFPGRLIQTSPSRSKKQFDYSGTYSVIDLDLSKYDKIASRFRKEKLESINFLKLGIPTRSTHFNRLMQQIESVAITSRSPILLTGETGTGKSKLAGRIYELKKSKHQVEGKFIEVNCATIRGDAAMSALFGHIKGSFTGAIRDRDGYLLQADKGILFLDEIGELGLDEQAMLLHAIEDKTFIPLGSDKFIASDFQLIAGTNNDLIQKVREGKFREDLLARINLWSFRLPALKERAEDIEPNIDYELKEYTRNNNVNITFSKEAKDSFLKFALSRDSSWNGNFRDLNAAITRMGTLAPGGRITAQIVREEIERLKYSWGHMHGSHTQKDLLSDLISAEHIKTIDLFDQIQLREVLKICLESKNLSDAGRRLFAQSRGKKKSSNDTDRLRKYLVRFHITWQDIENAKS